MAVIGNSSTQQAFTPAVDYFSGNGSTTAFTLSRPVASVAQVEAVIDNVVQNPSSAYTVSGNTITFTSAPLSGTNNIYVRYTSPITQVIAPGQGTVNTTALAGGTVTTTADATINGQTVGKGTNGVSGNTAFGVSALAGANSGSGLNTAVGYQALLANTTGVGGVALGYAALTANTTGNWNIGIGINALIGNTTGANNVAIGQNALQANTTASNNTAVGYQAGYTNSTNVNFTGLGYRAGYSSTADDNTCIGMEAGYLTTTGGQNTFIGNGAGYAITTGARNTILGRYGGNGGGLDIRTTSNNIVLSDGAGNPRLYCNSNGRWSMNGGTSALTPVLQIYSATQDADLQLGSTQNGNDIHLYLVNSTRTSELSQISNNLIARCGGSGGVYLSNGATSWAAYSDSRLKNVTGTYTNALADVAKLEPVKFTWKHDEDKKPCVGLIAQSIEKVVPEAIDKIKKTDYKETGDETEYLSVRYSELIPLLTASIQELKALVDAQATEIAELKAKVGV